MKNSNEILLGNIKYIFQPLSITSYIFYFPFFSIFRKYAKNSTWQRKSLRNFNKKLRMITSRGELRLRKSTRSSTKDTGRRNSKRILKSTRIVSLNEFPPILFFSKHHMLTIHTDDKIMLKKLRMSEGKMIL